MMKPPQRKQLHVFKETGRTDPYRSDLKPAGVQQCPNCRSVLVRGDWRSEQEAKRRYNAAQIKDLIQSHSLCPACHQAKDRYAQGVIELRGEFWQKKQEEVLRTVERSAKILRRRNDQARILWMQDYRNVTRIYVSLPDLARQIGRELEKSFHGVTEYIHSSEEPYLRVRWWSDAPALGHLPGAPLEVKRPSRSARRVGLMTEKPRVSRHRRGRGQRQTGRSKLWRSS